MKLRKNLLLILAAGALLASCSVGSGSSSSPASQPGTSLPPETTSQAPGQTSQAAGESSKQGEASEPATTAVAPGQTSQAAGESSKQGEASEPATTAVAPGQSTQAPAGSSKQGEASGPAGKTSQQGGASGPTSATAPVQTSASGEKVDANEIKAALTEAIFATFSHDTIGLSLLANARGTYRGVGGGNYDGSKETFIMMNGSVDGEYAVYAAVSGLTNAATSADLKGSAYVQGRHNLTASMDGTEVFAHAMGLNDSAYIANDKFYMNLQSLDAAQFFKDQGLDIERGKYYIDSTPFTGMPMPLLSSALASQAVGFLTPYIEMGLAEAGEFLDFTKNGTAYTVSADVTPDLLERIEAKYGDIEGGYMVSQIFDYIGKIDIDTLSLTLTFDTEIGLTGLIFDLNVAIDQTIGAFMPEEVKSEYDPAEIQKEIKGNARALLKLFLNYDAVVDLPSDLDTYVKLDVGGGAAKSSEQGGAIDVGELADKEVIALLDRFEDPGYTTVSAYYNGSLVTTFDSVKTPSDWTACLADPLNHLSESSIASLQGVDHTFYLQEDGALILVINTESGGQPLQYVSYFYPDSGYRYCSEQVAVFFDSEGGVTSSMTIELEWSYNGAVASSATGGAGFNPGPGYTPLTDADVRGVLNYYPDPQYTKCVMTASTGQTQTYLATDTSTWASVLADPTTCLNETSLGRLSGYEYGFYAGPSQEIVLWVDVNMGGTNVRYVVTFTSEYNYRYASHVELYLLDSAGTPTQNVTLDVVWTK